MSFREVSEHSLRETSTAGAPWIVISGADHRFRSLTAGRILLDQLKKRVAEGAQKDKKSRPRRPLPQLDNLKLLRSLDMTQARGEEALRQAAGEVPGETERG